MIAKKYLVWFEEVDKNDIGLVGGKGANLGEMINANLPIPYGFIVTSKAYFDFLKEAKLEKKIKDILSCVNYEDPNELRQTSSHIRSLINQSPMPSNIAREIIHYYDELVIREEKYLTKQLPAAKKFLHKLKSVYKQPLVAVRSSATAEDLPNASFAGQQETFLNVRGESHLLHKVKECWASLFTERAIYYRRQQGFEHLKVGLAAVVQRMVQSDKSGIAFSIDPVTNDKTKIVIEAIYGLGEYIVQGKVTPDHYEVDKKSMIILKKENNYQTLKLVKSGATNVEVKLRKTEGMRQKLSDNEIVKVALLVKDIENHYYFPQDIEWTIEGDRVFVVQSRPVTTIKASQNQSKPISLKHVALVNSDESVKTGLIDPGLPQPLLVGSPASPGIAVGPVKIILSPREIERVKKGDILVAPQTNPDYVPAMRRAAAIVTEKGGRTSHAAIVSRELGVPAAVGVENATKKLKDNMIISVNGETGEIFKGSVLAPFLVNGRKVSEQKRERKLKTITKIYVNLAEVKEAEKIAAMDVDGVGLLRAEFMIAEIGVHPKEFIKKRQEHLFINKLSHNLKHFAKAFSPRPVVYRATDFKTNEYRNLSGGRYYELQEENPMLGFRGAFRYIANSDVFSMELKAIGKVWEAGFRNLHLMIPFVRVPWELIKIKEIIKDHGLLDFPGFKLWIMVEVPACALNLEEYIKIGIDGVSIGTNDLTMMLLGVDRDNAEVSSIYDERNPLVMSVLEYIVKVCRENEITCSICGQAASDYPEVVERLERAGITSVSVNPDAVERTRELIYNIERKHFEELENKKFFKG